jgi:parallel beta-helix repeat protein
MITKGFLSYNRADDVRGQMPRLANRLEKWLTAELGLVGHNEFRIYRDLRDGNAGEPYEPQLQDAIREAPLFIAMVSRGYFLNENTRWELKLALHEAEGAPGDRYVQPIYTITGPEMYGDEGLSDDELVLAVKAIMRTDDDDWQDAIFQPLDSPAVDIRIHSFAKRLSDQMRGRAKNIQPARDLDRRRPAAARGAPEDRGTPPPDLNQLIVGQDQPYARIQDAIDDATPGSSIWINPGDYDEALKLTKPLSLIGSGRGDVVVSAKEVDVLHFQATMGQVAGITFKQLGPTGFGVNIAQWRLEMYSCAVESSGFACVVVHHGADPRIHNNEIHYGAEAGIVVHTSGLGSFEDKEISQCEGANVEISTEANPTFRRNKIWAGDGGGVYVHDRATGSFEANEIFSNSLSNVSVSRYASPMFSKNIVRNGYGRGVDFSDHGYGLFEKNDIRLNHEDGVVVSESGPTLQYNNVSDNGHAGIYCLPGSSGTIRGNTVTRNVYTGLSLEGSATPVITGNVVEHNRDKGMQLTQVDQATVEGNWIRNNHDAGVFLRLSPVEFRGNHVEQNGNGGIVVAPDAERPWVDELGRSNSLHDNVEGNIRYDKEASERLAVAPADTG